MVKIMIDPGHGGTDPGAVGNGLQEKNITLDIALRIRNILSDYEGVQVRLTRDRDTTMSLRQRTDLANNWGADFLLSIHINSGGGTGFETFIHSNAGTRTASIQNIIHNEIIKEVNFSDRGKKKADFHVLRESRMDALLTENGFIDHRGDAASLKDATYLDRIAKGHANGLVQAFKLSGKPNSNTGGGKKQVPARDINVVSDWAREDWLEAKGNGYFDGTRPGADLTREEAAIVLNRLRKNFLRLIAQNAEDISKLEERMQRIERDQV